VDVCTQLQHRSHVSFCYGAVADHVQDQGGDEALLRHVPERIACPGTGGTDRVGDEVDGQVRRIGGVGNGCEGVPAVGVSHVEEVQEPHLEAGLPQHLGTAGEVLALRVHTDDGRVPVLGFLQQIGLDEGPGFASARRAQHRDVAVVWQGDVRGQD